MKCLENEKNLTHMEKRIVKYLEWFEFFTQESKNRTIVQTVWMEGNNAGKSRN